MIPFIIFIFLFLPNTSLSPQSMKPSIIEGHQWSREIPPPVFGFYGDVKDTIPADSTAIDSTEVTNEH